VHPTTGLITASDQQGNYGAHDAPARDSRSPVLRLSQQFVAEGEISRADCRAADMDSVSINASGGNQVWLTEAQMGPLNEELIHFGNHRPEDLSYWISSSLSGPICASVSQT